MTQRIKDKLVRMGDPVSRFETEIATAESLLEKEENIIKAAIDDYTFAVKSFPEDPSPEIGAFKGLFVLTDKRVIFTSKDKYMLIPLDEVYSLACETEKDTYYTTLILKSQKTDLIKRQYKGNNDKLKMLISGCLAKLPARTDADAAVTESAADAAAVKMAYAIRQSMETVSGRAAKIKDESLARDIRSAMDTLKAIAEKKERFKDNRKALSKLVSYYLPTMEKMLSAYTALDEDNLATKEADALRVQVKLSVSNLKQAFSKIYTDMNKPALMDISSEITALNNVMNLDGLIDKDGMEKP